MTEKFAVFFRLPFEKKTLCIFESGLDILVEEGHELLDNEKVICLNFDDYIQNVTNTANIPGVLFDINLAIRILCGLPASRFKADSAPWKGISCLGKHLSSSIFPVLKSIEKGKFGNYFDWMQGLPQGWERLLINALKDEYSRLVAELKSEGLLKQFLNVEMPLKCMFSIVGTQGIRIDHERLISKYRSLDHEYFRAVKTLEISYGFTVRQRNKELSYDAIKKFVKDFESDDFSKKYFWESIELMQESSEFLKNLYIEHRNRWDLSELLRVSNSISECCKIDYDVFGTVTGRILLNRPGIQYLKRTSRDIFSPKEGSEFVYADYAQFEPGILASFSNDVKLIELYNGGDIYSGLASQIGRGCTRKIAKEMFLSFIYGMSRRNIRRRIVQKFGEESGTASDEFFSQFSMVEQWKSQIVDAAQQARVAKGPFAYIRRVTTEDTDRDIARWAPNHIIQSTASGIFKNALCRIAKQVKQCRLLVPMHDAILIECPVQLTTKIRNQVENIMINCFQKACKGVNVKISFTPFEGDSEQIQ